MINIIFLLLICFVLYWLVVITVKTVFSIDKIWPIRAITFHSVENTEFKYSAGAISKKHFEDNMLLIKKMGYKSIDANWIIESKVNDNEFLISFDDCYEGLLKNACPILNEIGFKALFFAIADFDGKYNTWDITKNVKKHMDFAQLRELINMGHSIGSHTMTHCDLTALKGEKLKFELLESKKILEQELETKIEFLAYPFGRTNKRVKAMVEECGYKGAFSVRPPFLTLKKDSFMIPTLSVYPSDFDRNFISKFTGNDFFWHEEIRNRIVNRFSAGVALVKGAR